MTPAGEVRHPTWGEAVRFWIQLGFINFGGPTGQIAIMHRELVERRGWIAEDRFLHALNYCMLLPGPEAQQLAIYLGWLFHRTWGGIIAGTFFVLPSIFILLGLSWVYVSFGALPAVAALFYGLKAAVLAIVAAAVLRISRKVLKNWVMILLAAFAFIGLALLNVPFPAIVLAAGLIGLIGGRSWPAAFTVIRGKEIAKTVGAPTPFESDQIRPSLLGVLQVVLIGLLLWIVPLALLAFWRGAADLFFQQGLFFSKAAMVTFGGAYAVLPYIAQAAVENYHWLRPGEMMDGLGLAETTPGPLIMVVAFVGYVGAWSNATGLSPVKAGLLGGLIATYFTFLPSFIWIFLGAPFIEQTRGNVSLSAALSAITAAVVGVILNLALLFGRHTLFSSTGGVDLFASILAGVAFVGLWKGDWDILYVIPGSAMAGLIYKLWMVP